MIRQSDVWNLVTDLTSKLSGGLTPKRIAYGKSDGTIEQNANLTFDPSTNSFYVGNPPLLASSLSGKKAVFNGDSVTSGTGAPAGQGWTSLLCGYTGMTEINNGVGGSTLEKQSPINPIGGAINMLDRLSGTPTYDTTYGLLVFSFGTNDWGYGGANYNPTNFQADYTTAINDALAKGWPASKILITSLTYTDRGDFGLVGAGGLTLTTANELLFTAAAKAVAIAKGTMYVDIFQYLLNRGGVNNLLHSQDPHPNPIGHFLYAQAIYSAVVTNIYANGQSMAVNGEFDVLNLKLPTKYVLADSDPNGVMGLDINGFVGVLNALPPGLKQYAPIIVGILKQQGALTPNGGILGANDILINTAAALVSSYATVLDYWGRIILCTSGASMQFDVSYPSGNYTFNVNAVEFFKIWNTGVIATGGAAPDTSPYKVKGDINLPTAAAIVCSLYHGFKAGFIPFDSGNATRIINNYQSGKVIITVAQDASHDLTAVDSFGVYPGGDCKVLVAGAAIVITSPNGTQYRFLVTNAGALQLLSLQLNGSTSGSITIKPQAVAGTYEFDLPITAGIAGQVLTSQGGAGTAMTWINPMSKRKTIFTPTTGGTVALVNNQYNIINPSGALLALTVNLPSSPANEDCVYIKFTQSITTVTYGNGTVVDGITAPTAGGLTVLVYDSGTTSWY